MAQCFRLLLRIRDMGADEGENKNPREWKGGTEGANRAVLNALVLRANPERSYMSFPTYELLAADTGLHPTTCQRSVKWLEDRKLVKRSRQFNSSNRFFVNTKEIERLAAAKNEERKAAAELAREAAPDEDPFPEAEAMSDTNPPPDYEEESWPAPAR